MTAPATAGPTCVAILKATATTLRGAAAGLSQQDPTTGQSLVSGAQALAGGLDSLSTRLASAGGEEAVGLELAQPLLPDGRDGTLAPQVAGDLQRLLPLALSEQVAGPGGGA